MASNLDQYKADLEQLIEAGDRVLLDLTLRSLENEGLLKEKHKKLEPEPATLR